MLTLIRREIEDVLVFYVMTLIIGIGFAGWCAYLYQSSSDNWPMTAIPNGVLGSSFSSMFTLLLWAIIFDALQRGLDQKEKTSTFLCTLTTTRGQLLVAKWLAAVAWLCCGLLPIIEVHAYYLYRATLWGTVQHVDLVVAQLGLMVLAPVSGYLLSQFVGLGCRPVISLIADILIVSVVMSFVMIKGVSPGAFQQISILLGVLSIAAAIGTWSKTKTLSL